MQATPKGERADRGREAPSRRKLMRLKLLAALDEARAARLLADDDDTDLTIEKAEELLAAALL